MHDCRFRSGHYSTKFIAEEYPEPHGFKGVTLSEDETLRMVAVAAAIHQVRSAPDEIRKTVPPPEAVDVDALVTEGFVEIDRFVDSCVEFWYACNQMRITWMRKWTTTE